MPLKGVVVYTFTIIQGFDRVYRLPRYRLVLRARHGLPTITRKFTPVDAPI